MGRISAVFIAFCMLLIAASVGIVVYASFGFTGVEASVIAIAVMTALVMVNGITGRQRDRSDVGGQIADLSRGTADMARQVSELGRRIIALEGEMANVPEKARAATEPLAAEIDELGQLVKELADGVAAHEQMLESAISNAMPARAGYAAPYPQAYQAPAPQAPAPQAYAPPQAPQPEAFDPGADLIDSGPVPNPALDDARRRETEAMAAQVARAIEGNRLDLYLQPVVTLPQRKVRYYEALARLRGDDGSMLEPDRFLLPAEAGGLMPAIDNLMVFRSVQVVRRLSTKNREVGLFCNISGSTLADAAMFQEITDFLEANRALAPYVVFEFAQSAVRAMGPMEQESLASLADFGFRFSMDHVQDLRIEPRELAERGFRFVKVPAELLLSRTAQPNADIHPADFSDLLGRYGIDLIAERIEREGVVVDLLDYDVRFGQGFLFSPPRPVRAEVLGGGGLAERPSERAARAAAPQAPDVRPPEPRGEQRAPEIRISDQRAEPRPPGERRPGAMAQLARGIVKRAQG